MCDRLRVSRLVQLSVLCCFVTAVSAVAGYKPKAWSPGPADNYPAKLTSEKVTIAAEPLLTDPRAAQVFDKNDIVTAGIMPLAIVIYNDNDFPVRIEASTIELLVADDHMHTLPPGEVVYGLFKKGRRDVWGVPSSRIPTSRDLGNPEALRDFEQKFLGSKVVPAHGKEGGFLYIHPPVSKDLGAYLSNARLYIPDIYREDNGMKMIYFEFELKPALASAPSK
jgi:hypothetical protein